MRLPSRGKIAVKRGERERDRERKRERAWDRRRERGGEDIASGKEKEGSGNRADERARAPLASVFSVSVSCDGPTSRTAKSVGR